MHQGVLWIENGAYTEYVSISIHGKMHLKYNKIDAESGSA
jgi:hypothetical protein